MYTTELIRLLFKLFKEFNQYPVNYFETWLLLDRYSKDFQYFSISIYQFVIKIVSYRRCLFCIGGDGGGVGCGGGGDGGGGGGDGGGGGGDGGGGGCGGAGCGGD